MNWRYQMDTKDIITLIIAIWGAILSTFLAVRELLKEKRSITIILSFVCWLEQYKITIINNGRRPVTISEIGIEIGSKTKGSILIPSSILFDQVQGGSSPTLPLVLTDGESVEFFLSHFFDEQLRTNKDFQPYIFVYDAEGNVYKKFKYSEHNPRYGVIKNKNKIIN